VLSEKMQDALNDQLNFELISSYLYMSMIAYFESESLEGMANWMTIQTEEERAHAQKFFDFINERDGRVILKDINTLKTEWKSPLDAFEDSLEHERKVTDRINKLVDLAIEESDHATNSFLQWFVDEQVEEEANVKAIIDKLKFVKDSPVAVFMMDQELGGRTAPPAEE